MENRKAHILVYRKNEKEKNEANKKEKRKKKRSKPLCMKKK